MNQNKCSPEQIKCTLGKNMGTIFGNDKLK